MTDQAGGAGRAGKFDASRPNAARIYDYLLGGKEHFAADREAAQRLLAALPNAAAVARANRAFLAFAVQLAARAGIVQYLDIGAGLPTSPSVHECARAIVPAARVAYIDSDPVAVTHAQALLATGDGVIAAEGDAREPETILADPAVAAVIDFAEPVCVLLVSMLHFVTASEADTIVASLRARMAPGSYLVISQGNANPAVPGEPVRRAFGSGITLTGRPAAEIAAYFDGFDLVPPGLAPVTEWLAAQPNAGPPTRWQPAQPPSLPSPSTPQAGMLAAIGRKRT